MKKRNLFFRLNLSDLTKVLFAVFFALFIGYSYAQVEDNVDDADFSAQGLMVSYCSFDWNSCIELASTNGCTHTFKISIESSDNFNNKEIERLFLKYRIKSGIGTIVSAEFQNPNGEMATKGTELYIRESGKRIDISHTREPYLIGSAAILDTILIEVEGGLDDCLLIERKNPRIKIEGFSTCEAPLSCADLEVCKETVYVSGTVKAYPGSNCPTTQNLGIEGAEVEVISADGGFDLCFTGIDGSYQANLGCYGAPLYDVCVYSNCTSLCGLSVLDLVLIQKHILKMKEFDDCIQYIAADANENGVVDSNDVKILRKIILGSLNPYDMCIFVPRDEFVLLSTCNDCQGFNLIDECIEKDCNDCIEFYRVMRGDVNQTCEDCNMSQVQGIMSIDIASQNRGQTKVSLPISDNIYAFSIKINLGKNAYISNISNKLEGAEYTIENGVLSFIWLDLSKEMKGVKMEAGEPLFTIESADTKSISLSEKWDNIVFSDKGVMGIKLDDRVSKREVEPKHIVIGGSVFEVELPENTQEAYVELFDITGKLLYSNKHNLQNNNTYINNIPYVAGVYLLSVRTSNNVVTKKVFLSDNK